MRRLLLPLFCFPFCLVAVTGCLEDNSAPEGLRRAARTGGPTILVDLDARPFPEIPFPNDLATRVDPSSPTGKRINVSYLGGTDAEEVVRANINKMDGFGVLPWITVRFDSPVDVAEVARRHQESVPDFRDDAVYLVDVDPDSPELGTFHLLDMGRGNYPVTMKQPDRYFDHDPRSMGTNLVYESVTEEDLDGDGVLDWEEDTDDDGIFDRPNTLDPDGHPLEPGQMLDFYERETNTLILKPVEPLRAGTTYAVVLTSALVGENGAPVDSPYESINHARQTEDLAPLRQILPRAYPGRFDERLGEVRFAWTFTTQNPTSELEAIRAGLYGHGKLGWLAEKYPARLELIHNAAKPDVANPMVIDLREIIPLLVTALAAEVDAQAGPAISKSFDAVDYIISGSFVSPYFLADRDGLGDEGVEAARNGANPQDDDELFDIDLQTGEAVVGEDEVTFLCSVPKETETRKAPFPTVIYSHAISTTRLEALLFAGSLAKFGLALCTIDSVGHGAEIPPQYEPILDRLGTAYDMPLLRGFIEHHRARDLTNDGVRDSGGLYFTADLLHSRDNIRQTTVDQLQLVRILRSWDGKRRFPASIDEKSPYVEAHRDNVGGWDANGDGESEIAGDFNGDGTIDFGGDGPFVTFGTSLGGIQSTLLAGIEPTIRAAAVNAGGGALGEIALRTLISNVRNGVMLRMMGPLLVGERIYDEDMRATDRTALRWILPSGRDRVDVPFAEIEGVEDGDIVVMRNLNREQRPAVPAEDRQRQVHVRDGVFRIAIASDADEATRRRAVLGFDPTIDAVEDLLSCLDEEAECDEESIAELERRTVEDAREFGDPLVIEIRSADGELKQTIDTFPDNVIFENILYPAGTPLAALTAGWGLRRQTPEFRRFIGIAQTLLDPADPAVWATHYKGDTLKFPYEEPRFQSGETNLLMIGTVGDQTVPINTGLAIARAAGILDSRGFDVRYGSTPNQYLVDNFVYEGIFWLDRFVEYPGALFDADDLDEGLFRNPAQRDHPNPNPDSRRPLRAQFETDEGIQALRLAYLDVEGAHTFNAPTPSLAFDTTSYMTNQVGWYLSHGGKELIDDVCFEDLHMSECDFFDAETFVGPEDFGWK